MNTITRTSIKKHSRHRKYGFLEVDLMIALAIFALAIVPLAFSILHERRVLRKEYLRAVTSEIVDGEMEILAAGEWRDFPQGSEVYHVHCQAAAKLPSGHFELTRKQNHLRLAWMPDAPHSGSPVFREITVK